ncbi:Peptidase A1 domain-containing protein [Meloidogyne graminicola]|uniref:Peptidase A1 domain-containing protein n=1 Tax=Meloidogyne graminicola TaxID=189291 RepID=A0A8T0A0V9_9BILA|nr:Peptidase A1 domain-containing protein [Meloidogyne graminicola]
MTLNNNLCINISIGTPNKNYYLFLKFNSSIFWLNKESYDKKKSTTSKIIKKLINNKEGINGNLINDKINIGNINLNNITFISAESGIPSSFKKFNSIISGSFGLFLNNNNQLINYLNKPIITLQIKGLISSSSSLSLPVGIGQIIFGDENLNECINYQYIPNNQWSTAFLYIQIGENENNSIISPGGIGYKLPKIKIIENQFYMYGPKNKIDEIAKKLNISIPNKKTDFYILPCEKKKNLPNIKFNIGIMGGKTVNIILKPNDYIETFTEEKDGNPPTNKCRLYFLSNELIEESNNLYWTMGQSFMFNRCISVNLKEQTIGFGEKKIN